MQNSRFAELTDRQRDCLAMSAERYSRKEIAYALGISDETVKTHIARAVERAGFTNQAEALAAWREEAGHPKRATPFPVTDPDAVGLTYPDPQEADSDRPASVGEERQPFLSPNELPVGLRTWSLHELGRWINDLSWRQVAVVVLVLGVMVALGVGAMMNGMEALSRVALDWYRGTIHGPA